MSEELDGLWPAEVPTAAPAEGHADSRLAARLVAVTGRPAPSPSAAPPTRIAPHPSLARRADDQNTGTRTETGTAETSGESARLLVVGNDINIVELLCTAIRSAGYEVRTAASGDEAATVAERWAPDLMVQDGFKVTRYWRGRRRPVPAIFLTPGDQLLGKLPGLTIGGGDYVTKPFSPEELLARIRVVLRRTRSGTTGALGDGVLRFADLELTEDTYDVRRAGQAVRLTPTEFSLLRYLMHNAEKVLTSDQILEHVWPYSYAGQEQVVQTYILKLRHKVDRVEPRLIHTLRGFGYSLRLPQA